MSTSAAVQSQRDGAVVTIKLTNGNENLLNPDIMNQLYDAIVAADQDESVFAIVLSAAGEMFCGGLDVAEIRNGGDPVEFATALVRLLKLMPKTGTALVAAVNGDALASGFSIACACDIVVTVPEARLGTFEAGIGIWPMIAQVPPLQRLMPRHALQNIITGVPFSAEEALEFGAVNRIVTADRLQRESKEMALAASVAGPMLAAGRKSFYRFCNLSYDDALDEALDAFTTMLKSPSAH